MFLGSSQELTELANKGGNNQGSMFVNTDICLFFDVQDGDSHSCCTETDRDCHGNFQNMQFSSAQNVCPEAHAIVNHFLCNDDFNTVCSTAWELAAENSHVGDLKASGDVNSCIATGPTPPPTPVTPTPVPPNTLPAPVTPAPVPTGRTKPNFLTTCCN